MNVDVWVENHQPVPLAPLRELALRPGTVLYIGKRVTTADVPDREHPRPGWVVYDGADGFAAVGDVTRWWDDQLDWGASLGRLLQPGEVLHVRYTSG